MPEAVEALREWVEIGRPLLARPEAKDALFVSNRGRRISKYQVYEDVRLAAERVGVVATTHDYRRSVATMMLDAGMDLRKIQEWLRHKYIGSTQWYLAVSGTRLKEAVAQYHPLARRNAPTVLRALGPVAPRPRPDILGRLEGRACDAHYERSRRVRATRA